ncbi:undecaprenyldiphospho-muramoylpentapeptide beta-N-acetylglucosaminyltransferase [Candidatus Williamhamiltonella defendens]|uniref:UDP-N-acetylglucosamine--N-acetylmuramyl-(pentapeptide) pyrophosphoryl-undecaprenol N-acetylglucosamine transferase n=1 Tax=Candidatus Hamiltonella defensa (Bemisia tabaci) TaxID=672795 RepID=A0A249DZ06_9ENTR|nr:undecaprenyldiphospho-muramoylpentapeptide beta-N-acetylglucosaminyltransferase [Candidatus Hamiltonella defensa]ASX26661.1 undecaprenyldiphospho-muramoylpentapeptide beta-N-acetylglucosaminyltransferase [Candidatus Hamiltonella defensa (Bemisia tabaci)]CED78304.1 UDP-N-acetylglucosamine--N-acetylmuramyl-(pentapeptide) pyrophosphoryl-undecaprenol N-acetylglucosamine transferase [Candidatus Hamiltonella defensa (Bemisia tabaci)]
MMQKKKRLMVLAGGTGGHIFPALSVAHHLMAEGWHIRWMGTKDRMEATLVPQHGIEIDFIEISGLKNKRFLSQVWSSLEIFRAVCQAKKIIRAYQPDAVLGMGGYVSGPAGLAAWLLGVPLVVHEQNAIAGFTNRCLGKMAKKRLQAFSGALSNAETVGNPVRAELLKLPLPNERFSERSGPLRILVLGGSQGADILNQIMPSITAHLGEKILVWHQVGKNRAQHVLLAYQKKKQSPYKVVEFIDCMAKAYCWADVIFCRSGALTVSEVAVVGLPAIFVPFQHKDRQQYWNALPLEKAGAAKIVEQNKLSIKTIVNLLESWDRSTLIRMAEKAKTEGKPDATEQVVSAIKAAIKTNNFS